MKHRCPTCCKPTDSEADANFPFCSDRCRLLDLGEWAAERYVVSQPIFDEEELEKVDREKRSKQSSRGASSKDEPGE